jgi:general secretion pathway protein G
MPKARGFLKDLKKKFPTRSASLGFSLIEVLIVVTILAILLIVFFLSMRTQLTRSRDTRRKADLEKIKVAFENYYNDNGCYPSEDILDECRGSQLSPYLSEVPCDPEGETPYLYVPISGDECGGYRLFTRLQYDADPVIAELGCDDECGCGYGPEYNYGVSAGVPLSSGSCMVELPSASTSPSPAASTGPQPSPSIIYVYACWPDLSPGGEPIGTCKQYAEGHPDLQRCRITFPTVQGCQQGCQSPVNRCQ